MLYKLRLFGIDVFGKYSATKSPWSTEDKTPDILDMPDNAKPSDTSWLNAVANALGPSKMLGSSPESASDDDAKAKSPPPP